MTSELLIGLGGLVLTVLAYFAGVWRTERRRRKDDRDARIQRVFDRYMDFRRKNATGGTDGLLRAGAATLASDDEVHELVERIAAHGEKHPLGADHETSFARVALLQFFQYAARERVNFLRVPLEEVIVKSGARH